ncbi:MAG: hypothetical protein C0413_05410, partial [Clostridiales bacterium]|nr:hypothetical protein [Clostridiales bacterium]
MAVVKRGSMGKEGSAERSMKPPEIIDVNMLAPCGLNCMLCYRHLGKKPCPGCRARESQPDEYQRKCVMRACVT